MTPIPTETNEISSAEGDVGFEVLLAIGIIIGLAFYLAEKKKKLF